MIELDINLNTIRADYSDLIHGISDFIDGYPSTHIIPDSLFLELLSEASKSGNGLLFPQQHQNLALYRKISKVFIKQKDPATYFFYLAIPLAAHTYGSFNVYEVNSLPLPIPNSTNSIEYIPEGKYLAISDDHDRFLLLNDFHDCIKIDNTLICHPQTPIFSNLAHNCLYSIFKSSPDNTCKKQILFKFPPKFIRVTNGFLYATDVPLSLKINCPNSGRIAKIESSGFLPLDDDCHVSSKTFSVPSHMNTVHNCAVSQQSIKTQST